MRRIIVFLMIITTLMTSNCSRSIDIEAEMEAIKKIEAEFDKTGLSGDVDGIVALYTDDAVCMQPNGPTITGREAIRAWTNASFERFNFVSKHSPDKIDIVGDLATVPGNCKGILTPKSGGDAIPFNNKYLHIYKKQSDGTWRLSLTIFNSNDPLPSN